MTGLAVKGLSDFRWPDAPYVVAAAVVLLLLLVLAVHTRRGRRREGDLLLAHTARLRGLPRYRALVRQRRTGSALMTLAALLVVAGTALVLARPQTHTVEDREPRGRDLMLCLDASASMDDENAQVVAEMKQIVGGLHGDRVGMVIWSGAAVQVFPLTDDYGYVDDQLDVAEKAFQGVGGPAFYAGVDLLSDRASLIGDGIVSCVNRFDPGSADRTRAVIVSSDNDPAGTPVYTLDDAAGYAAQQHVLIYGIGAASLARPGREAAEQEMADAATSTGGTFGVLGSAGGAQRIVDRIDDLEKARATEPPREVTHDTPYAGAAVCAAGVLLLVVGWLLGWLLGRPRRGRRARAPVLAVRWLRRLALVGSLAALVVGLGNRPEGKAAVRPQLDVLVAVDQTASMSATDDPSGSRIIAARRDLTDLVGDLGDARVAIATFGKDATLDLPLTSDHVAVTDAIAALQTERPSAGIASTLDRPVPLLLRQLNIAARGPAHVDVVVFVSDGEATAPSDLSAFARIGRRVQGAAVLGYGTEQGGEMPLVRLDADGGNAAKVAAGSVVVDPRTGQPAVSHLGAANLERIASVLGGSYVAGDGQQDMAAVAADLHAAAYAGLGPVDPQRELRWVWGLALLLLTLPELLPAWRRYLEARRAGRP